MRWAHVHRSPAVAFALFFIGIAAGSAGGGFHPPRYGTPGGGGQPDTPEDRSAGGRPEVFALAIRRRDRLFPRGTPLPPRADASPLAHAENRPLGPALLHYVHRQEPEDVRTLTRFLEMHPGSRYEAALPDESRVLYNQQGWVRRAFRRWRAPGR